MLYLTLRATTPCYTLLHCSMLQLYRVRRCIALHCINQRCTILLLCYGMLSRIMLPYTIVCSIFLSQNILLLQFCYNYNIFIPRLHYFVLYIYITHFYVFASYNVLINTIPRFIYIYIFIRSKANLRNRSIVFIVIPLSRLTLKNSIYSSEYTNSVTAPPCLFSSIANNRYSQSKG